MIVGRQKLYLQSKYKLLKKKNNLTQRLRGQALCLHHLVIEVDQKAFGPSKDKLNLMAMHQADSKTRPHFLFADIKFLCMLWTNHSESKKTEMLCSDWSHDPYFMTTGQNL